MSMPFKQRLLSSFGVLALVVILVVLAVLQYRWSRELNDAASDRMRAGLHSSMVGLREDVNRELAGMAFSLPTEPPAQPIEGEAELYLERFDAWRRTASHPGIVGAIYLWEDAGATRSRLLRLDTAGRRFEQVEWPAQLIQVRESLAGFNASLSEFAKHIPEGMVRRREDQGPLRPDGNRTLRHFPPRAMPWFIEQAVPAVLHPQIVRSGPGGSATRLNWVIVQLDRDVIGRAVLPELAQKYFAGPEGLIYDVAVVTDGAVRGTIYSSNAHLGSTEGTVDARMYLFGPGNGPGQPARETGFPALPSGPPGEREWHGFGHGGPLHLEPLHRAGTEGAWVLLAKHRKGSLDAALAALRRRHMAISFGILLMLAITLAMIIAATRRAQRLAKLQMDFVAGVSHELRTPLAVISSAADNIADGIIDDKRKVARYGEVIRNQSRQLSHLVEQILLFAATRQERYQYTLTPLRPAEILRRALANSAELIRTSGVTVEEHIDSDLPSVMADLPAVSHCVQNLIINAVKYGGEKRWIGVRARLTEKGTEREVQISVEDKGIGIEASELHRIFDPFYRSPAVVGAQIHGTGLGLALAKSVAESMGGRLTVSSKPGEGSVFILHLPFAPEAGVEVVAAVSASGQSDAVNR